jgi:hypothetical protein
VISHELDQADNYVEVGLSLAIEGKSLRTCIAEAEEIIDNIKQISTDYCKQHATKEERKGCADLVEVSEYEVEPKYHNIKAVGSFIDAVLAAGGDSIVINEIVWKAHKVIDGRLRRRTLS